jgi:hypothetical protein
VSGKHIYVLVDPRSGKERYVGASADPERRLEAHVREARGPCETAKCQWIRELDRAGLRPEVRRVTSTPAQEWRAAERTHIGQRDGLTNAGAGDGVTPPAAHAWWEFWK